VIMIGLVKPSLSDSRAATDRVTRRGPTPGRAIASRGSGCGTAVNRGAHRRMRPSTCRRWDDNSEERMSAVTRLLTFVDLDDRANDDATSVSARHEAELADGSRVLLLDDRGWTSSGPCDTWSYTSVEDVVSEARTVVGPDKPFGSQSQEDTEVNHWAFLQRIAQRRGVVTDAAELRQLPHDVVVSPRLLARIQA